MFFVILRKYATQEGQRHFWEARYITTLFDASPKCLIETERVLKNNEGLLRFFTIKQPSVIDRVNSKSYKNPFGTIAQIKKI